MPKEHVVTVGGIGTEGVEIRGGGEEGSGHQI